MRRFDTPPPCCKSNSYNKYHQEINRDKPCHNSSCEPTAAERRSKKKLTDRTDAHGVFDHGFFDLCFFDAKGFQTDLQA